MIVFFIHVNAFLISSIIAVFHSVNILFLNFRDCPEPKPEGEERRGGGGQRQERQDPRRRNYNGRGGGLKCYKCNLYGHFAKVRGQFVMFN